MGDVSPFPLDLPPSLDDATVIREHDWQAFCRLTRLEDHWTRPGWTPGRRSYHWLLTVGETSTVARSARRCQARLSRPGLDAVPLDCLHLTMGRIGFTDEIDRATVDLVASAAVPRCEVVSPLRLLTGPLSGSTGALRFTVTPWKPLLALHDTLVDATRAVLGKRTVMDTNRFRPHLSIAYANTTLPVPDLLPVVDRLRTLPVAGMPVTAVALVEMRRERRSYRYDELRRIVLRGTRGRSD